jgi:hypothetical protein
VIWVSDNSCFEPQLNVPLSAYRSRLGENPPARLARAEKAANPRPTAVSEKSVAVGVPLFEVAKTNPMAIAAVRADVDDTPAWL